MRLRRDFQAQAVQADEAGGVHPPHCCYGGQVVLVVGLGWLASIVAVWQEFTLFSGLWQPAFHPAQRGSQSVVSESPVRAAVAADRECS